MAYVELKYPAKNGSVLIIKPYRSVIPDILTACSQFLKIIINRYIHVVKGWDRGDVLFPGVKFIYPRTIGKDHYQSVILPGL